MKNYIYRYKNKITGNSYIGKTNNPERRHREHKSMAFNPESAHYDSLWAKKIREYGIDGFEFSILEEVEGEKWKERERYWIEHFNSFHGPGYNLHQGGEGSTTSLRALFEDEIEDITRHLESGDRTQDSIAEEFGVSRTLISNINTGLSYRREISYPIRKNYKNKEDYSELIRLLRDSDLTYKEIADRLKIGISTVKKINYGLLNRGLSKDYPIRKETKWKRDSNLIIDLLKNTDMTQREIAKKVGVSPDTVSRINRGVSHRDPNIVYPVR